MCITRSSGWVDQCSGSKLGSHLFRSQSQRNPTYLDAFVPPPKHGKRLNEQEYRPEALASFFFFFFPPPSLVIWFRIKQKVCMAFQFGWTLLSVHFALTGFLQGQAQFLCYRVRELRLCVNYMLLLVISPPGLSLVHQGKLVSQVRRSFFMLWIITKECQHC